MGEQKVFKDRSGDRFGRLVVLYCTQKCNRSLGVFSTKYLCLCDCGETKEIAVGSLRSGATKSCGCLSKEITSANMKTHGSCNTPTYGSWRAMRERCYYEKNKRYSNYGGKGIKVCSRWLESYTNFLSDMGERPEGKTLDRINPKKDYTVDNCRWADNKTQAYNKNAESDGSSIRVGVSWHKRIGKWQARIRHLDKEVHLGYFEEEDDAISARVIAEIAYRGENLK